MERSTPASEHAPPSPPPRPSRHASFRTRGSGEAGQSLESFAIATTPFHEPTEDGEYYMDETGNWLHRWVTHTEVHAAKACPATLPDAAAKRHSAHNSDTDAGKEDSGWEDGPAGSTTMERSVQSSSSSSGVEEERQVQRPRLNRHSRSSVIPSERANHKSPERMDARRIQRDPCMPAERTEEAVGLHYIEPTPLEDSYVYEINHRTETAGTKERTQEGKITNREESPCQTETEHNSETATENVPAHILTRTLSCPSAPTQLPIIASTNLSNPPSPRLARTQVRTVEIEPLVDLDASENASAGARRNRSRNDRSRRTVRAPRPWPDLQLHRAATEDPFVAHQRAMELFSPQRAQPEPMPGKRRRSSLTAPVATPPRTISAAEFLASKPDEVQATIPTRERRVSQAGSTNPNKPLTTESETADSRLNQSTSQSTLNHSTGTNNHSATGIEAVEEASASPDVSHLPVLVDHRIAIDWTHPETREKAERKRRGVVSKVKRLLSRSRSRPRRRSASGGGEEYADSGSVRKLRVESIAKVVREEAVIDTSVDEIGGEPNRPARIAEKAPAKKNKRRLSFFG